MTSLQTIELGSFDTLLEQLPDLHPHEHPAIVVNTANRSAPCFFDALRSARGLVADFDGTLHPGNQWAHLRACMTPEHRADDEADLARYFDPKRIRTTDDDLAFIFASARRLRESGLLKFTLATGTRDLPPRPGARALIVSFEGRTAVVSYGVWDWISRWTREHGVPVGDIFALRLEWNPLPLASDCIGMIPGTVITEGNKGYARDVFRAHHKLGHEQVLVIGDAPTDLQMMDPTNVGVLILPKLDPDPGRMKFRLAGLRELWPRVSAILIADTLEPLVELRCS